MSVQSYGDMMWADCPSCGWQGSCCPRWSVAWDAYLAHLKQRHPILWKRHLASQTGGT